jgi:phosphatidylinositol alpha-1,6-mannosyltransferase
MREDQARRPRIVLVTRNLPPLRGGMERLNLHIALEASRWADLVVIGPEGSRQHLPRAIEVIEIPVRPLWRFLLRSASAAWRAAMGADLILAGSGLTAPAALLGARRSGGKAIAYLHGLDLVTPHPIYRACWLPAMRHLAAAITNSRNTARIAQDLGVAGGRIAIVHPGTKLPSAGADAGDFRDRFGLGDDPLLLSVGRLTERKGLAEFVEEALPRIVATHPGARLLVIGDDAPDALKRSAGPDPGLRLQAAVRATSLEAHVRRLGACDDATLQQAYAAANVHVFPGKNVPGDVEGFGMVAIEAAAQGLPTVAFDVGGIADAVAQGASGYLVAAGDYEAFASRVCDLIAAGRGGPMDAMARGFAQGFSWEVFGERLRTVLEPMVSAVTATASGQG